MSGCCTDGHAPAGGVRSNDAVPGVKRVRPSGSATGTEHAGTEAVSACRGGAGLKTRRYMLRKTMSLKGESSRGNDARVGRTSDRVCNRGLYSRYPDRGGGCEAGKVSWERRSDAMQEPVEHSGVSAGCGEGGRQGIRVHRSVGMRDRQGVRAQRPEGWQSFAACGL